MTDYLVPLLLLVSSLLALRKKENTYNLLIQGGAEGLRLLLTITPALVILLTAIHMLRASGAVEILSTILAPLFRLVGIPPETAMLVLIRPISGSAALAVGAELMARYGPDSPIGRTVAVMLVPRKRPFIQSASILVPPASKKPATPFLRHFSPTSLDFLCPV